MAAIHRVPDSFIDSTISFISGITGARHIVFFWLNSHMLPVNCRTGYHTSQYQEFLGKIAPSGPVSPKVLVDSGQMIGCLHSLNNPSSGDYAEHYRTFLGAYRFVDEVDVVFRCGDDVVAGVAAFRHIDEVANSGACAGFSNITTVLENSVPYIEFNLSRHLGANKGLVRSEIIGRYGLTAREAEVAELIGAGCTNSDIAGCLGLGLATVKTHIINLFRKVGVENRSSLVALLPR